jgi:hypothetical protein
LESFVSAQEYDKAAEAKNKLTELDQEKSDLETEANSVNNFQTRIEKVGITGVKVKTGHG